MCPTDFFAKQECPDPSEWEKIEKYTRNECDIVDYFGDWSHPWGKDNNHWTELYRPKERIPVPGIGFINFAYLVIVTIPISNPNPEKLREYIQHKTELLYPMNWPLSGRAFFLGEKTENNQVRLAFLIADPRSMAPDPCPVAITIVPEYN